MMKSRIKRVLLALVVSVTCFLGHQANATVIYNISATCTGDCEPLGVLTTHITTVTGSLTLAVPSSPIAESWNAANVTAYSFNYGTFQISNTNSTLADSVTGNNPFTTAATAPFSPGDGFLVATYNPDHSVFLNITLGGLNLNQGSLTSCTGTCQAQALSAWSHTAVAVPEPASLLLFGGGFAALAVRRKRETSSARG